MTIQLTFDEKLLLKIMGEAAAKAIRESGQIPEATGELERSIRYDPETESVRAIGSHSGGISNAKLLGIQAARLHQDPLRVSAATRKATVKAAQAELRRQAQTGRAKVRAK